MNTCISKTVTDLLDSSSSSASSIISSSSEDEFLQFFCDKRMKDKLNNYIEEIIEEYTDEKFRKNFRVHKNIVNKIILDYKNSRFYNYDPDPLNGDKERKVSAKIQIYAFLWFAGTKFCSYRKVASVFRMSVQSLHKHFNNILDFFFEISDCHIRFPITKSEQFETSKGFYNLAGLPNILGCLGTSSVNIRKPVACQNEVSVDRTDSVSITVQGICDSNEKFFDIFISSPVKIENSRLLDLSPIIDDLPDICGKKCYIVGNGSYPLHGYLLTPFDDATPLSTKETKFNLTHIKTLSKIDDAFRTLKARFQRLIRFEFQTFEKTSKFILACCILHNICIKNGDEWKYEPVIEPKRKIQLIPSSSYIKKDESFQLGKIKRDKLCEILENSKY